MDKTLIRNPNLQIPDQAFTTGQGPSVKETSFIHPVIRYLQTAYHVLKNRSKSALDTGHYSAICTIPAETPTVPPGHQKAQTKGKQPTHIQMVVL